MNLAADGEGWVENCEPADDQMASQRRDELEGNEGRVKAGAAGA
eukprot:CAMPEP_0174342420 /NCGR_PEP_ID=MMETSP0810-20121108/26148_1 /TAXON_ID=73025 ORGANISM="Eutreptiella gymnastica-like, Strain CCMP1594" /NCGR_SAMPLE_ID=MMETSP0810 /ASSEMBLY_ACC=CAM_ASM_000659 /LENGTH=43 /DNA_ID= /DNA_START= /DNA_END= /DNA_ORIENTATION=